MRAGLAVSDASGASWGRVLRGYGRWCGFCALQHVELLDTADITPEIELRGEPIVSNGMSLCRLHHAAFDRMILGSRPDYIIQVPADVLEEMDRPMLRHGLQEWQGQRIWVPSRRVERPDAGRLAARYGEFLGGGVSKY